MFFISFFIFFGLRIGFFLGFNDICWWATHTNRCQRRCGKFNHYYHLPRTTTTNSTGALDVLEWTGQIPSTCALSLSTDYE